VIVLAGIVISVLVLAVLAFGLPWLSVHRDDIDALDGDPAERFSGSMRILRENTIADYDEDEPPVEVSTPLTRRAELTELRLMARAAAMRRRRMVTVLGVITLLCLGLSVFNIVPGWAVAIPVVALVAFLVSARAGVKQMHRRFDEKAAQVKAGYTDGESTSMMKAVEEEETSREFSVDLTAPETTTSPSPQADSITTRLRPVTGSRVNATPAASAGIMRCTTTARATSSWANPRSSR